MAKRPLEEGSYMPEPQGYGSEGHMGKSAKLGGSDDAKTNAGEDLFEQRFLIDNYEAGVIIGKGGSNVKDLRTQSACFLSVLRIEADSKERILTIKGLVPGIALAIKLVTNLLVSAAKERSAKEGSTERFEDAQDFTIKLLIHKFLAGCIIGKGGSIIRDLQSSTGAKISLSADHLGTSTEKSVSISGSSDVIFDATSRILSQLKENPLREGSSTIPYVPGVTIASAPPMFGGPQGAYGMPPMQGYPPFGFPGSRAPPPPYGGSQRVGFPPGAGGYGAPTHIGGGGPEKIEKIVIPSVCAGTVIGKNGTIISDIKQQSGTTISLAMPEPTAPEDRIVTIRGTESGIQRAIQLIRMRVESYRPPPTV